jgi:hypothetical protein
MPGPYGEPDREPVYVVIHGQHLMDWRLSLRMLSHDDMEDGTPNPKNHSPAAVRIAASGPRSRTLSGS